MRGIADRLQMLVEVRSENQQLVRSNASDAGKDESGSCSSILALDLRFFAIADYVLYQNIDSFRSKLSKASQICATLYQRFENGEPIDHSLVTMLSYKALFDALAAGDMETAKALASHMGGRDELERKYDHPFDYALGYTLRSFILNDVDQMHAWPAKFIAACGEHKMKDFNGYGQMFEAILANGSIAANEAVKVIVKGHQKQSKGRGVFANTVDEVLCVWGIGMVNLARSHGLEIEGILPLIPNELLI